MIDDFYYTSRTSSPHAANKRHSVAKLQNGA
jgi:hypothetical protein